MRSHPASLLGAEINQREATVSTSSLKCFRKLRVLIVFARNRTKRTTSVAHVQRTLYACAAPDFFQAPRMTADEATPIAIRVAVPGA
jgi:hypothetical protein